MKEIIGITFDRDKDETIVAYEYSTEGEDTLVMVIAIEGILYSFNEIMRHINSHIEYLENEEE